MVVNDGDKSGQQQSQRSSHFAVSDGHNVSFNCKMGDGR